MTEAIDEQVKPRWILDGHKLMWHTERVEAWRRGERIAPITIDCALTRRCNYRCVYCYGQLQANDEKKMTRDDIFRFLDDAAEIGVKGISLVSDGESTCSPFFREAILRGSSNGLDMAVGTNGYLLKEEDLEEILRCLTYLRFNISAGEARRYSEIMGCGTACFERVCKTIRRCAAIKKEKGYSVTIGLQMVLLPEFADQILPLTQLGRELGADYLVIKHCSDDENGTLGVEYGRYYDLVEILKEAEKMTDPEYQVSVKWSKVLSRGKRCYRRCYGPPFLLQLSGSGLVAPCGMLFNEKYKAYHIGNIAEQSFKQIWQSERYWDVMGRIASEAFDAQTMCGTLCLQHKVNEYLDALVQSGEPEKPAGQSPPAHINFI